MCGIVGITLKDPKLTAAITSCVTHRGPDQSTLYDDASVSLGHQRLSILDLSERGRQPTVATTGPSWWCSTGRSTILARSAGNWNSVACANTRIQYGNSPCE
jgi:asparagine synthetase B (glutamine-hydrolysing)